MVFIEKKLWIVSEIVHGKTIFLEIRLFVLDLYVLFDVHVPPYLFLSDFKHNNAILIILY